jgi:hypothetical protein
VWAFSNAPFPTLSSFVVAFVVENAGGLPTDSVFET